jgi:hypothetical protein
VAGSAPVRQRRARPGSHNGLKRHALRAQQPRLVLQLRGHFNLLESGPDEAQNVLEQPAPHQRRLSHQGQFVFVLHQPQSSTSGAAKRRENCAEAARQRGLPAGKFGHGSPRRVKSGGLAPAARPATPPPPLRANRRRSEPERPSPLRQPAPCSGHR